MVFESETIETEQSEQEGIDPKYGEDLAAYSQIVSVHRIHTVCNLTLEDWVVLRDLKNLPEGRIDELVRACKEGQTDQVTRNLHILVSISSILLLSQLPEDAGLQESLHSGQENEEDDRDRISKSVNHEALVEEPPLFAKCYFALGGDN